MKIGITCYPVAGGSGIVATELGQQLAHRGHQVHFISYAIPFRLDRYQENLFFHGVETTAYPLFKHPPYALTLAAKMADVSCNYQLEILHVHYAIPHATSAFLARQLTSSCPAPKIITTLHGTDITLVGSDPSFFDITRFSINASDGVTAVSQYLADETQEIFKLDKPIKVIHNFFDGNRFMPDGNQSCCKRRSFAADDEFIIAHISNFRPVKRTIDVIEIFEKISAKLPAKLLLIGEGPETILARRQVNKKGLSDRVTFMGNQSQVEAILPLCDLFLLPSEEESFGLAALEALACGVPVIGTLETGLVEVVEPNVNGYLLPIGHTTEMAEAGINLLMDKNLLNIFKENAHTLVKEKFNQDKIVSQYEDYYREILHG
ncbi:MAG: N-acetyl-alpha-D-glucosaminyl L-malate synthase BshA [candidate division Zixibacteria bacterium HGW-Zixibacteria-1]|nr:MAG: N-acetyl-alpha-D-glucosaminyl L-malate synthase BshA [candidate division Zixibacteria bacterium HGW-Zixibacteria-1]